MFSKFFKILDLYLKLFGVEAVYPALNWLDKEVVSPLKANFKKYVSSPLKKGFKRFVVEPSKRFVSSVSRYLKSLDIPILNKAIKAVSASAVFCSNLAKTGWKNTKSFVKSAYLTVTNPIKKYVTNPINKSLDGTIDRLENRFGNLVEKLAPELKAELAEQLRTAWKASHGNDDIDNVFQKSLGQALEEAINITTSSAPAEKVDQKPVIPVAVTFTPAVRSFVSSPRKAKFQLSINLSYEFAQVFSNNKMDKSKRINASDVIQKSASSFFAKRGYKEKFMSVSVKSAEPPKVEKHTQRMRVTGFEHLLAERRKKDEAAAASLRQIH